MPLSNNALWERISAFAIDKDGIKLPFSKRLAREKNWSHAYALNAIAEYKKFIYLVCVSPTPLTPSEEVDEVWHLHLTYTRSYWDDFCSSTLNRPVHHTPTDGGAAERGKFVDLYHQTFAIYRNEFDMEPPTEFWPSAVQSFSMRRTFKDYLKSRVKMGLVSIFGLVALAGCASSTDAAWWDRGFWDIAIDLAPFALIALFILVWRFSKGGDSGGCSATCGSDSGCSGCGGD